VYNSINDIKEMSKIIKELNKNISTYYIPQHIPMVIILGIFQSTFIVFCIVLLKTR
jgi:hypothetical protein